MKDAIDWLAVLVGLMFWGGVSMALGMASGSYAVFVVVFAGGLILAMVAGAKGKPTKRYAWDWVPPGETVLANHYRTHPPISAEARARMLEIMNGPTLPIEQAAIISAQFHASIKRPTPEQLFVMPSNRSKN